MKKQKKEYAWITPQKATGKKFEDMQLHMSWKLKFKVSQDKLLNILMDTYKDFGRLNNDLQKYKEKVKMFEEQK